LAGKHIVFEGIDGAGTTTQAGMLYDSLKRRNITVCKTFEPTPGPVGSLIRLFLQKRLIFSKRNKNNIHEKTLALLFAADRLDHLSCKIYPRRSEGYIIISDRFKLSSLAYQSMDVSLKWVKEINKYAPEPDLTIFLDIDVDVALERIENGRDEKELFEEKAKLDNIAKNYRTLVSEIPEKNKLVINGTKSVNDIHRQALKRVLDLLK
jgi:dTMP kinase